MFFVVFGLIPNISIQQHREKILKLKASLDYSLSAMRSGLVITESGDLPNTVNRFRRTKRLTQNDNPRRGQWSKENVTLCYVKSSATHYSIVQIPLTRVCPFSVEGKSVGGGACQAPPEKAKTSSMRSLTWGKRRGKGLEVVARKAARKERKRG
jgi:hypothetical protein